MKKSMIDRLNSKGVAGLMACAAAGLLGALTIGGCSAAKSGPEYHGDIDHDGQPFDGVFKKSSSSDGKTAEVECKKACEKACEQKTDR